MKRNTDKKKAITAFNRALRQKRNAINAVVLRDMRTRFFNHGLGFVLVPLWPFVHMGILIIFHSVLHKGTPPIGNSLPLFYAIGLIPALAFIYVSRFMAYSLIQNRAMLAFPAVKVLDVMMGRAFLEIIANCITIFIMGCVLWASGVDPFPRYPEIALIAYSASILLALGCGTLVGVVSLFFPMVITMYQLIILAIYISSGVMFVASDFPDRIGYIASFNPLLECVEWMRVAYYEAYDGKLVYPMYIISFGALTLLCGLIMERVFRRQLLGG